MPSQPGFLDLEDYVSAWAWQMFEITKSKDEGKLQKEHLRLDINWDKVRFQHDEPTYHDKRIPPNPKAQVVFSTTFVNDTNVEHEYSFRTERTTRSTCEIFMSKGVTNGVSLGLALKTPCEVFQMNAGFSREVNVTKSEGEIIEKELVWSVDSNIKLPPQTKTQASLVVNQEEFDSKFSVISRFWGRVMVTIYNLRDNNNFVRAFEGNVEEIFRGKEGFTIDKKRVAYSSEGQCHFRYGVEQRVDLNQQPLNNNHK